MENYSLDIHSEWPDKFEKSDHLTVLSNYEHCSNNDLNLSSDFKLDEFKNCKRRPPCKLKETRSKKSRNIKSLMEQVNSPKKKDQKQASESINLNENSDSNIYINKTPSLDQDIKKCPACCKLISNATYASHIIWCLKQFGQEMIKTIEKQPDALNSLCPVCQQDLSDMTPQLREQHSNRCIDDQQESGSSDMIDSDKGHRTRYPVNCPLCGQKFHNPKWRLSHMKLCAVERNVTSEMMIEAVKLQEKHLKEWRAAGFDAVPRVTVPQKQARHRNRPIQRQIEPRTVLQADLQMAKAISLSLHEEEQKKLDEQQHLVEVLHDNIESQDEKLERALGSGDSAKKPVVQRDKKNKARKNEAVPLLLLRTTEDRTRIIAERLESIIAKNIINVEEECPVAVNWKKIRENLPFPKLLGNGSRLWNMATITTNEVDDSTQFYVKHLTSYFTPSKVKPGSKLKHLSQIPGYKTLSSNSFNKQHEILEENEIKMEFQLESNDVEDCVDVSSTFAILEELRCKNISPLRQSQNSLSSNNLTSDERTELTFDVCESELKDVTEDNCPFRKQTQEDTRSSLEMSLLKMVSSDTLSDMKIIVNDESCIPCHQFMLHARCPQAYEEFLANREHVSEMDVLRWPWVSYHTVIAFLEFVYSGNIVTPYDEREMGMLAERFHVDNLKCFLLKASSVEVNRGSSDTNSSGKKQSSNKRCWSKYSFNAAFIRSDSDSEACDISAIGIHSDQYDSVLLVNSSPLAHPDSLDIASDTHRLSTDNCLPFSFTKTGLQKSSTSKIPSPVFKTEKVKDEYFVTTSDTYRPSFCSHLPVSVTKSSLLMNTISEEPSPVFKKEKCKDEFSSASDEYRLATDNCSPFSPSKARLFKSNESEGQSPVVKKEQKSSSQKKMKCADRHAVELHNLTSPYTPQDRREGAVCGSKKRAKRSLKDELDAATLLISSAVMPSIHSIHSRKLFVDSSSSTPDTSDLQTSPDLFSNNDGRFSNSDTDLTINALFRDTVSQTLENHKTYTPDFTSAVTCTNSIFKSDATTPKSLNKVALKLSPLIQDAVIDVNACAITPLALTTKSSPELKPTLHKTKLKKYCSQPSPLNLKYLSPESKCHPVQQCTKDTNATLDLKSKEDILEVKPENPSVPNVSNEYNNDIDIWDNFNDGFSVNFSSLASLPATPISSESYKTQENSSCVKSCKPHLVNTSSKETGLPLTVDKTCKTCNIENVYFNLTEVKDHTLEGKGQFLQKHSQIDNKIAYEKLKSQQVKKKSCHKKIVKPLPRYSIMPTPDIKKELHKIGVRPLPKKQAVKFLKHVYRETHPTASKEDSCAELSSPLRHSSKTSHLYPRHQSNISQEKPSQDDQKGRTDINDYIKRNGSLYLKVLQYEPIDINSLQLELKSDGIKCTLEELQVLLDKEGVTYTSNTDNSPRKRRARCAVKK